MSDDKRPIQLIGETPNTVTLRRVDFEGLLAELENAEDRIAVLEYALASAKNSNLDSLTVDEVGRLLGGENPVRVWREKRGMTQRELAQAAGVSQSQLAEIETGTKGGSLDTLRKLSGVLKVMMDSLVPAARVARTTP